MKKRWFKKSMVTSMVGALVLSGVLAGCSSGSEDGKTTITVWGMGEEAKSLPKIAEEFEKENPKIDVKVQALPWDQAHDKLLTAVASKKGPDVVQMGTTWIPEFASAGALKDLTPHVKDLLKRLSLMTKWLVYLGTLILVCSTIVQICSRKLDLKKLQKRGTS